MTSLNTCESYDPSTDCWKSISAMNKHRSAAGVVSFDNHIYVLGGHDGLSIFDSVEKYNPQTGRWSLGVPMLSKRCRYIITFFCDIKQIKFPFHVQLETQIGSRCIRG